jgi:ABC-type bacteriocin/lantibiotic exporter with double-glycine peptidase domain
VQSAERFADWRWLRRELRPLARLQALAAGCLLAATALSLVDPLILSWLLDVGLNGRRWRAIEAAITLFLAAFLGRSAALSIGLWLSARAGERLAVRLRLRLLRRWLRLDTAEIERRAGGDFLEQTERDVDQIAQVGADLLPSLLRIGFSLAVTLAVMFTLDWRLSLLALPFVPALALLTARFRRRLELASDEVRRRIAARAEALDEARRGAVEIRVLAAERFFLARYRRRGVAVARATLAQRRLELVYHAASFVAATLATAAMLWAGARELVGGRLTLGGYIAFYTYLTRLFGPLSAAVETNAKLKRAGGSIRRVAASEAVAPAAAGDHLPAIAPREVASCGCRGVCFGYPSERPVLHAADLCIERGEAVALIGESGCGKTTLAKLLARLYEPAGGSVHLGGRDVREVRLRSLRERISYVATGVSLFSGTLYDNAVLGRPDVAPEHLRHLARIACFDRVVERLDGGWEHVLSSGGGGLSDGERQRLGLLRALVHGGEVLILDEATGALDPMTEADVLAGLRQVAPDKAILFITHRPAAAAWADRTVLLRSGELVETEATLARASSGRPDRAG